MGQEIELKLMVREADLDRVAGHPLVGRYARGVGRPRRLANAYYDTPDLMLFAHRMALRVRQKGERFVQTLKSRGASMGGLARRGEWEWPLADDRLQPELVPEKLWPAGLAPHGLGAVFRTDFERRTCDLSLPADALGPGQPPASIELALDRGAVTARPGREEGRDPISEVELELLQGDPATLYDVALAIAEWIPVQPCDISKAERGYRLLDPGIRRPQEVADSLDAAEVAENTFAAALKFEMGRWIRITEWYHYTGDPHFRGEVVDALERMRWLLDFFQRLIPETGARQWRGRLASVAARLNEHTLPALEESRATPQGAGRELPVLMDGAQGRLALELARWIHCRQWRAGQDDRHRRAARTPTGEFAGSRFVALMERYPDM